VSRANQTVASRVRGASLALLLAVPGSALAGTPLERIGIDLPPAEPGCAAWLRGPGGVEVEYHGGVRERGGAALDAHTNFRLASVSKQFTAMTVMLLVADGRLSYESSLADLLPGFPAWARRVTVRHLLTHTSGVPDYERAMERAAAAGGAAYTPDRQLRDEDAIALLRLEPALDFEPGTNWAYSNSAYVLLGQIVARADRRPFSEVLERRIFGPLGMRGTRLYVKGQNHVERRAYGHEPQRGVLVPADQSSTSATQGDGGIYSNIADLARWDAALREGTLLPAALLQAALVPVRLADGSRTHWPLEGDEDDLAPGQPVSYGYGWFVDPLDGHRRMWHFGTTRGFRSAIMRLPDDDVTTIVLCNRSDLDARLIAERLLRDALEAAR
jgi:CubicO group peptidase (beta-lactamase class C family)